MALTADFLLPAFLPARLRQWLPQGYALPEDVWRRRHGFIVALLWAHVAGIIAFGAWMGVTVEHAVLEAGIVGAFALAAGVEWGSRRWRATAASLGLLSSSAVLIHLSGGYIEMHFHFFVIIPIIALYQSWTPFLLAIAYVALHHGIIGHFDPQSVFNHAEALAHPWRWAGVHAVFILLASAASLFAWRTSESAAQDRVALAEGLLQAERRANELRTDLLRIASHELKTPLTPLHLQLAMLKSETLGPLAPRQQRSVDVLHRNLGRLTALVEDVLDAMRLQEGRMRLAQDPVDLRAVAQDVVDTFRDVAAEAGVVLRAEDGPPVPVRGDANRLAQVATNLVSNALKFTPAGGHVWVRVRGEAGRASLSVVDTGRGLTGAELGQLFRPFAQVHDANQSAPRGTGLGLYISKGIVEQHGGVLRAASRGHGRGAVFTIDIPVADAQPPAVEWPPASAAAAAAARR